MSIPDIAFAIWLFLGYGYFGAVVKVIDKVVDENRRVRDGVMYFLIASCGLYAGLVMVFDQITAAVGLSLVIGVTLAGKLDAWQFVAITAIELVVLVVGINIELVTYLSEIIGVIVILTFSAVFDEVLVMSTKKNPVEQNPVKNVPGSGMKLDTTTIKKLLSLRPILKAVVLVLPLLDPRFTYFHAACVWFFDIAYETVNNGFLTE
ncbi:MAG: hypothetical protein ACXAEU_19020 [Candidatus Hodarchaeales archaeon]